MTRAPEHMLDRDVRGAALEIAPDPVVVVDQRGRVVVANRSAREVFAAEGDRIGPGFDLTEHHSTFGDDVTKELREFIRQGCEDPALAYASFPIELDGDKHYELHARPIETDEDGDPGIMFVIHDVSEHVRSERQLAEAADRFRRAEANAREQAAELTRQASLLDLSHDAIFVKDSEGTITFWARGAQELYGWSAEEAVGQKAFDLLGTQFPGLSREEAHEILKSRGRWDGELIHTTRDGRHLIVSSRWVVKTLESGATEVLETNTDVTAQAEATVEMEHAHHELEQRVNELEEYNRQVMLLGEMGELMQNCPSADEAFDVAQHYIPRLFADDVGGALYVVSASRDVVTRVVAWGECLSGDPEFPLDNCWALRRSRPHFVGDTTRDVICRHVDDEHGPYACVPMIAQGELLGIMHVSTPSAIEILAGQGDHAESIMHGIADQLALTVANLRMQESLKSLSVHDPLTGLYNRRFMEAAFERELARAQRHSTEVGVLMMDVDEFKNFNDTYGHDAGDDVLRGLGQVLSRLTRGEDIACRFGGEEFVVILPGASIEVTMERAEAIRKSIETSALGGSTDGAITISIGGACFPENGHELSQVLHEADKALYTAKTAGRNQVRVAGHGATDVREGS